MNTKLKHCYRICWAAILSCVVSACMSEPDFGETPNLTRFSDTPTGDCPAYTESVVFKSRSNTVIVDPQSDWIRTIQSASADTEILFAEGDYNLDQSLVRVGGGLTIRSLSGDRDSVRIVGMGYNVESEGFSITGNDVIIAELSVSNIRDHAVSVQPASGALQGIQLYNLNLYDIGTQHIKVNPGGSRDGLIACSSIGYSIGAAVGDYNGAIDLHGTINWLVRDNYIYNITGDGSGCLIDKECGSYISAPAILVWNNAEGTRIIGNTIVDSFRNIALGIGTSHFNGVILHNSIVQSSPGDAGIELYGASDAVVEFNTVQLAGNYPGTIEYRGSNGLTITNNWLSSAPWNRGNNQNIELSGNAFRVPAELLSR